MRFRLSTVVLTVAVLAATGSRAAAGYEFRFADNTGAYTTAFNLNYPATVDVRVYLVATGADAATLAAEGLRSFGVRVNYDGTVADVLNTGAISNNAAFTGTDVKGVQAGSVASDFARSNDSTPIAGPYVASSTFTGEERVLLATFTFSGISNGTTTTLTVDPFPTISNTSLGSSGTAIDALIANQSATITVTNVPEPGTLALGGLLVAGLGAARLRRLRRPVAA